MLQFCMIHRDSIHEQTAAFFFKKDHTKNFSRFYIWFGKVIK